MTFNLLDYTDKLASVEDKGSWFLADCPVCGLHKLKINATTGAYRCYANECTAKAIRNKVKKWSPFVATNLHKVMLPQRMYLKAEPLAIPDATLLSMALVFVRCSRQEDPERQYYYYTDHQRTVRFVTKDGKKVVAPQYLKDDKYVSGVGVLEWLLFNEQHINTGGYVCMAEGEKCAVAVTNQGYECLTPVGFCWTDAYLTASMARLQKQGIKGILYFQDNDLPGNKKTTTVANAAWRIGLQCSTINPAFCLADAPQGYDIADSEYEIEDLVTLWVENGR